MGKRGVGTDCITLNFSSTYATVTRKSRSRQIKPNSLLNRLMMDCTINTWHFAHRPDNGVVFRPESLGLASKDIYDHANVLCLARERAIYFR